MTPLPLGYSWKEIKAAARKPIDAASSLVVVGDFATQHLALALQGVMALENLSVRVQDTDYDQLRAQVLDPDSELYRAAPDTVLFALCTEKLYDRYCDTPAEARGRFAQEQAEELAFLRGQLLAQARCRVFQTTWPTLDDATFGGYACKVEASFPWQLRKLNQLLWQQAAQEPALQLVDMDLVQQELGRANFSSDKLYYVARMPYTQSALILVAQRVASALSAAGGRICKCVVLDLDNTLWGGVIGDDGLSGIQIGELGAGRAFLCFQRWLRELKARGILLAVCSKNDEAVAKEPFRKHPDMALHLEDFAAFVANWEDKASNIRQIRDQLDVGMDSLVFVDDNPFERRAVSSLIPEICVPEMPEDPAEYVSYLRSLNLFETASYSRDDANRTLLYRERQESLAAQAAFDSYDDYLKSLDMKAVAAPFDAFHFPRLAQLTQRSNQFNLRTGRYTEEEIAALAVDPQVITLWFGLRDRFADHGLISLVVLDKRAEGTLFIREWLMSCRVLKRGMEEFVADTILRTAKENGCKAVVGQYLPTPKNAMVAGLLERLGFQARDGQWVACPDTYSYHTTYIEREDAAQ